MPQFAYLRKRQYNGRMARISVVLDAGTHERAKVQAVREGKSLSTYVAELVKVTVSKVKLQPQK